MINYCNLYRQIHAKTLPFCQASPEKLRSDLTIEVAAMRSLGRPRELSRDYLFDFPCKFGKYTFEGNKFPRVGFCGIGTGLIERGPEAMKALVKKEAARGLVLMDSPKPAVGINDVLIRILKTSICGTDVHIYNWNGWAQKTIKPPMITGHEFVGTVAEIGGNVHDFAVVDLVIGEGHLVCGHCRN